MPVNNQWSSRSVSRRTALRGAGAGLAGLAGAALIGCSGGGGGAAKTDAPAGASSASVAPGQAKLKPGQTYSGIFPTATEQDPIKNGKKGGTYKFRIFDSPHMDFNKILSSTVNTPNDLTKNKLFRLALGAKADAGAINVEGDLVEKYEVASNGTQYTLFLNKGVKF
ncbi:MAG: hypothetical protein WCI61_05300, partial [Chloroflexota bacterium]